MPDEDLLEAAIRAWFEESPDGPPLGDNRSFKPRMQRVLEVFLREQDISIDRAYRTGVADGLDAGRRELGARDEALREAIAQERAQFQRETLRTSELHRMLERAGSYIRDVDGPDSPLARAFAREILELLSKPINAAAPATEEVE